ncbi:MAG: hypothetical protein ACYCOS_06980 [Sulfobacillus sp.]
MSKPTQLWVGGLAVIAVALVALILIAHRPATVPATGKPPTTASAAGPSQKAFTAKLETLAKANNPLGAEPTAQEFTNQTTIPAYAPTAKTAAAYASVAPKMLQGEYQAAPLMTEAWAASVLVPSAYVAKMEQVPLTLVPVNGKTPWQAVQITYGSANSSATVVMMMEASEYHSGTLIGSGLYAAVEVSLVHGTSGWKVSAVSAYTASQAQSLYQQYGQYYKP